MDENVLRGSEIKIYVKCWCGIFVTLRTKFTGFFNRRMAKIYVKWTDGDLLCGPEIKIYVKSTMWNFVTLWMGN